MATDRSSTPDPTADRSAAPAPTAAADPLATLRERLAPLADLQGVAALLEWDRHTQMPEGGVEARAEQAATVSRLHHELHVDPEVGRLIEEAAGRVDPDGPEAALVREARRDYELATRLPGRLVAERARITARAEPAWARARQEADWSAFAPHLERIVEVERETADHYGWEAHPLDALLDRSEPGLTVETTAALFEPIASGLVPLVQTVVEQSREEIEAARSEGGPGAVPPREAPLHGRFDEALQEQLGREVITAFGYDWERGRLDRSVHPFSIDIGEGDVRITTRYDPTWLSPALFGTLHEAGHALYEQNLPAAWSRTPLGQACSVGVHESQSRLWENHVGRSRPFWSGFYPRLVELFPAAFADVSLDTFLAAVNASRPTPIRVEADELTYDLHVLLRFELERDLVAGDLAVADVPAAWNARLEELLGITPADDAEGALQDVHWSAGMFGYFPTYTLGNVLSAQLFERAVAERPEIPAAMEKRDFTALGQWLDGAVWSQGRRWRPEELARRATGQELDPGPYLRYLEGKFGEYYELG